MNARASAVFLLLPSLLWAKPEVMFSSLGGVQHRIVQELDHSAQSIDIAMFDLTARPLVEALQRAARRGVAIRLVRDAYTLHAQSPQEAALQAIPQLQMHTMKGRGRKRGFMHHKFAIIDGAKLITGSYNWTQGAEYANYENALFEDDPDLIDAYEQEFERLWSHGSSDEGSARRERYSPRRPRHRRTSSWLRDFWVVR